MDCIWGLNHSFCWEFLSNPNLNNSRFPSLLVGFQKSSFSKHFFVKPTLNLFIQGHVDLLAPRPVGGQREQLNKSRLYNTATEGKSSWELASAQATPNSQLQGLRWFLCCLGTSNRPCSLHSRSDPSLFRCVKPRPLKETGSRVLFFRVSPQPSHVHMHDPSTLSLKSKTEKYDFAKN